MPRPEDNRNALNDFGDDSLTVRKFIPSHHSGWQNVFLRNEPNFALSVVLAIFTFFNLVMQIYTVLSDKTGNLD
jgi:hypothetical protein